MREAAEDITHISPLPRPLHGAPCTAERLLQPPQSPGLARILPGPRGTEQQRWRCARSGAELGCGKRASDCNYRH